MYHALYVFTLLIIKLFSYLPGIIEGYSLWINSYANNYGICMECYIAMTRSIGRCCDLKGIVQEFFNATRDIFIARGRQIIGSYINIKIVTKEISFGDSRNILIFNSSSTEPKLLLCNGSRISMIRALYSIYQIRRTRK